MYAWCIYVWYIYIYIYIYHRTTYIFTNEYAWLLCIRIHIQNRTFNAVSSVYTGAYACMYIILHVPSDWYACNGKESRSVGPSVCAMCNLQLRSLTHIHIIYALTHMHAYKLRNMYLSAYVCILWFHFVQHGQIGEDSIWIHTFIHTYEHDLRHMHACLYVCMLGLQALQHGKVPEDHISPLT